MRGELLQPVVEVPVQAGFVVVDEDRGRDVHGVDQAEPLPDAAFAQAVLDLGSDVEIAAARAGR